MVAHPLDDEAVFNIARKIESAELRAEYVQQVCGNDPQLLARVERLLRIHEQERGFPAGTRGGWGRHRRRTGCPRATCARWDQ